MLTFWKCKIATICSCSKEIRCIQHYAQTYRIQHFLYSPSLYPSLKLFFGNSKISMLDISCSIELVEMNKIIHLVVLHMCVDVITTMLSISFKCEPSKITFISACIVISMNICSNIKYIISYDRFLCHSFITGNERLASPNFYFFYLLLQFGIN